MTAKEYKLRFIDALYNRNDGTGRTVVKAKANHKYVVRCPYCGDSSDPRKAHFYLHINPDDNSPILFNCFKCPVGGKLNQSVIEKLGITDDLLLGEIKSVNRNADMVDRKHVDGELDFLSLNYELPKVKESPKLDYLRSRLGIPFTLEQCEELKVITSLKEFLDLNHIRKLGCEPWVANMYERDYIGFLSHGNTYILFRDITNKNAFSWVKYPISKASVNSTIWYSIDSAVDLFTKDTITIHMAEGVMDIIGVKHHLVRKNENQIYIAVTGKSYLPIIYHLIKIGFCGYNVELKIYADNDAKFNKKNRKVEDTSIEFYRNQLKEIKLLFKSVHIIYNDIGKDFGVPKNMISIYSYKL